MPNALSTLGGRIKRALIPVNPKGLPRFVPIDDATRRQRAVESYKKSATPPAPFDLRTPTNRWTIPRLPYRLIRDVAIRVPRIMACASVITRDSFRAGFGLEMPIDGQMVPQVELNAWSEFLKGQDVGGRTFKDVLHCTFLDLEFYDDFFWEIVNNAYGKVLYVRRIDPITIERIETDDYGNPVRYIQNVQGKFVNLLPSEVIHGNKYYKGGTYGLPPIVPVWEQSGLYLFAIAANGDSYEFSRTPKGLLILPVVSDKFWEEFKAERRAMESGESVNRILEMRGVVNPGVAEFIKFSEDNLSLQYKDQMEMIDRNISTVYGVPDIKLGLVSAGKVANPDMQLTTFYDVIAMGHETVADKINQRLTPLLGITRALCKFNNPAEEDLFRMITMGKMGTEAALFTINEWRMWMNKPPVAWGDVPMRLTSAKVDAGENNNPDLPDGMVDPQEDPEDDEDEDESGAPA